MRKISQKSVLRAFAGLALVEGIIVLASLLRVASDPENAVWLGFSPTRLVILAGVLAAVAVFGALLIVSAAGGRSDRIVSGLDRFLERRERTWAVIAVCFGILLVWLYFLVQPFRSLGSLGNYYLQAQPLIHWVAALALQTLIAIALWRDIQLHWDRLREQRGLLQASGWALGILLALWLLVALTGLGVKPDLGAWYPAGTPLLLSQVCLAVAAGLALLWLQGRLAGSKTVRLDFVLCAALWIAACLIWWGEPVQRASYHSPPPVAPNFDHYPYAEAAEYDINAHNILLGYGPTMGAIRRPLYSFFLAVLHVFVGEGYGLVLNLQVAFLAVIPVVVYLLTSLLSNRAAGLAAAVLITLRERNSIALTNILEVSHVKLLMSDVPTMALMLVITLACAFWLKSDRERGYPALAAGAAVGLGLLLRSQIALILPAVFICAWLAYRRQLRLFMSHAAIFAAGVALVALPWLIRNYVAAGELTIENNQAYLPQLATVYSSPGDSIAQNENESDAEFYARLRSQIIRGALTQPVHVMQFYASHFFHNEVSTLMYLPLTVKFYGAREYVDQIGVWDEWRGHLPLGALFLFSVNLFFIAVGVGSAWRHSWIATLTLLLIHFAYSFSVATFRLSGWRLILPMDWIAAVFYIIGIVQVIALVASLFLARFSPEAALSPAESFPLFKSPALPAAFFLIGLLFVAAASFIPERESRFASPAGLQSYLERHHPAVAEALPAFLEQEDAVAVRGNLLYPRSYEAGRGLGDRTWPAWLVRDYARLGFYLIGPDGQDQVVLPGEYLGRSIPNASEVIVYGCRREDYIEAVVLLIRSGDTLNAIGERSALALRSCANN